MTEPANLSAKDDFELAWMATGYREEYRVIFLDGWQAGVDCVRARAKDKIMSAGPPS